MFASAVGSSLPAVRVGVTGNTRLREFRSQPIEQFGMSLAVLPAAPKSLVVGTIPCPKTWCHNAIRGNAGGQGVDRGWSTTSRTQ